MIEAFVIIFCLALSVSLAVMPISIALGHRWGIVAIPGGRRKHEGQISKLGGIAVFAGFMIAAMAAQFLPIPRFDPNELIRFTGLMLGAVLIFIVGLIDDKYELNALQLGVAQIFTAGIAVGFQIFIETVNNPLTAQQTDRFPFLVTVTLSMFWFGVMINTVNFLDGLDGLAGGVAFICSLMLFIHSAFILNQTSVSLLPLALMGASLGFLLYNFNPAKIFLGGGAYLLGYLIGALSIIGGAKMATILMVMGLPLMDFAWQVISRLRRGKNPMQGDRGHLHFRLLDLGYGQRSITMLVLILAGFAMIARQETRDLAPIKSIKSE
ncbi:MAG: undecaprenyl/decaprenyl-phosphate alpha-N-acetylglucosaminyl 1-phosphate transferase [Anaerolineae bacterium]|nr:undecaprenyl/decaprenyl-phosphate alpha-N-acetylglucosaminyl 1-phosphate transferase [Anaerolineae bacterium]